VAAVRERPRSHCIIPQCPAVVRERPLSHCIIPQRPAAVRERPLSQCIIPQCPAAVRERPLSHCIIPQCPAAHLTSLIRTWTYCMASLKERQRNFDFLINIWMYNLESRVM
jgi:hypothetical protein